MRRRTALVLLGSLATAAPAAMAAAAQGVDLLDLPAAPGRQAAHRLMLGVARAGSQTVAVGERGIALVSRDDGATWGQASVPVSVTLTALQFVDARHGWAVGHDGVVLSTSDGGATWQRRFEGNQANQLVMAAAEAQLAAARPQGGKALEQAEFAMDDARSGAAF